MGAGECVCVCVCVCVSYSSGLMGSQALGVH